jgi:hypothetical protein
MTTMTMIISMSVNPRDLDLNFDFISSRDFGLYQSL